MIRSKTSAAVSSIFSPKIPAYDFILAKNDMRLIVVVVTNFLRLGCRLFARSCQTSSPSGSCVTSNFLITPHGKGNTVKLPGDALPAPPPPHLRLNSELCIVPSYVANDAENSALRFIKAGFHVLEKSWTIRQGFHSLEKSLNFRGIP